MHTHSGAQHGRGEGTTATVCCSTRQQRDAMSWRAALWLVVAARSADGANWAVLVAGSSGWFNYRHQVRASASLSFRTEVPPSKTLLTFTKQSAG